MRIQTLSSIYCKSKQRFGDDVTAIVALVFLITTTIFLSADWFMDESLLPKNMGFVFGIILWGFVWLVKSRKQMTCFSIDMLSLSFSVFIGYIFICSFFTPEYIKSVYLGTAWLLFVLLRNGKVPMEVLIPFFSLVGIVEAIYGVLQYLGFVEGIPSSFIIGSFENPAGFAVCLSLCYPFLLCWSFMGRGRMLKLLFCSFLFIMVILSGSRTGMFTFFVATFLFCINRYRGNISERQTLFISSGILMIICLFIGLIYLKPASTSGRMLIWKVSMELCGKHICGNGMGSFKKDYMSMQADYLSSSKICDSEKMLAGETNHPFNEYLLLLIELGVVGFALLLFLLYRIFKCKTNMDSPEYLALFNIALFSSFSYPFRYAFVWLVLIFCLSLLAQKESVMWRLKNDVKSGVFLFFTLCIMSVLAFRMVMFESEWKYYAPFGRGNVGLLDKELAAYVQLNNNWNGNPYFLYNYGSELNRIELYEESNDIYSRCELYLNTYSLQMQWADNYYHLSCWTEAEQRYRKALAMCPNRFLPLQGLLRLYIKTGNYVCAEQTALEIINKPIKIPSYTISVIQEEAKDYLSKNSLNMVRI